MRNMRASQEPEVEGKSRGGFRKPEEEAAGADMDGTCTVKNRGCLDMVLHD